MSGYFARLAARAGAVPAAAVARPAGMVAPIEQTLLVDAPPAPGAGPGPRGPAGVSPQAGNCIGTAAAAAGQSAPAAAPSAALGAPRGGPTAAAWPTRPGPSADAVAVPAPQQTVATPGTAAASTTAPVHAARAALPAPAGAGASAPGAQPVPALQSLSVVDQPPPLLVDRRRGDRQPVARPLPAGTTGATPPALAPAVLAPPMRPPPASPAATQSTVPGTPVAGHRVHIGSITLEVRMPAPTPAPAPAPAPAAPVAPPAAAPAAARFSAHRHHLRGL